MPDYSLNKQFEDLVQKTLQKQNHNNNNNNQKMKQNSNKQQQKQHHVSKKPRFLSR